MPTYARIQNGKVAELFTPPEGVNLADCFVAELVAQFVPVPDDVSPAQGWSYNGATFAAPPAPADLPPAKPQRISSTAFLNRFTDTERGVLYSAAMTNPQMLGLLITCAAAGEIDLTDAAVQAGINGLVPSVLATSARAAAILDH